MKANVYLCASLCAFLLFSSCNGGEKKQMNQLDSIHQEIENSTNKISAMYADTTKKYHEGLISFEENEKFGFKDSLGNVIIKPQFDQVGCFNEGLVSVTVEAKKIRYLSNTGDSATMWVGGKMGFIDKTGNYVVKPKYDYCNFFSQGVAVVAKDDKWGYIDRTGKEIIKLQYDRAMDFWDAHGFAAVCKNNKWGLIDITGRIIVPLEHKSAMSTQNGEAHVFPFDKNIICYHVYNDGRIMEERID